MNNLKHIFVANFNNKKVKNKFAKRYKKKFYSNISRSFFRYCTLRNLQWRLQQTKTSVFIHSFMNSLKNFFSFLWICVLVVAFEKSNEINFLFYSRNCALGISGWWRRLNELMTKRRRRKTGEIKSTEGWGWKSKRWSCI